MTADEVERVVSAVRQALAPTQVKHLAAQWLNLTDDEQAQFFIEIARLMEEWEPHNRFSQLFAVGRHLRDCHCSSDSARAVVLEIAGGMGE